jgi:hypothetical protein
MGKPQDWKKLLKADPTDWLLEEENTAVRYMTLRDIFDAPEKEVKAARKKAHKEGPIAMILENMNPEGWWVHPGYVYTPKMMGTSWAILALAQMGGSMEEDKRIATACNYLLDVSLSPGGQFSNAGEAFKTYSCLQGNMLYALMDLGCRDQRLDAAYEWMARTITGEDLPSKTTAAGISPAEGENTKLYPFTYIIGPLFPCRHALHCAWAGAKQMLALAQLPEVRRTPLIKRAIQAGVKFFLTNDPANANFPGETAPQPDPRWWKFTFPVAGFDLLQVAEALTALCYGHDPRMSNLLGLIREKQDSDGKWPLEKNYGYSHKWWVKYGTADKPSKWVTLRAMRVLKRAGEQQ